MLLNTQRILLISCFFLSMLCVMPSAKAQIELRAIPQYSIEKSTNYRITQDSTQLELPFFEDFSTYLGKADLMLWEDSSSAWVYDGMSINPPSMHAACFDGIAPNGKAYSNTLPTSMGYGDSLVSKFIDLSSFTSFSNLMLTFYVQQQGRGEKPDSTDFLVLEFLDRDALWREVWKKKGDPFYPGVPPFEMVALPITDDDFIHPYFKFRFRWYGRLSGPFDSFHIDYIYLNNGRVITDLPRLDIACSEKPTSFLKKYSAMPLDHFLADTLHHKADTVRASANNLHDLYNVVAYECVLEDADFGTRYGTWFDSSSVIMENEWGYPLVSSVGAWRIPSNRDNIRLKHSFHLNTGDGSVEIPGINLRRNDTISFITTLDDYYAYDDGAAEYAAGVNQKFAQLAYRYQVLGQKELTYIDIYFPTVGKNLGTQTFNLFVWDALDYSEIAREDKILYAENVGLFYADSLNSFIRFKMPTPVLVSDTFFIGMQQLTEEMVPIGLDRNLDSGGEIFYNVSSKWERNTNISGSLMMRPIFTPFEPTAVENDPFIEEFKIYPNPTQGVLRWDVSLESVQIFDLSGRLLYTYEDLQVQNSIQLPTNLIEGMYLFVGRDRFNTYRTRFIVSK